MENQACHSATSCLESKEVETDFAQWHSLIATEIYCPSQVLAYARLLFQSYYLSNNDERISESRNFLAGAIQITF